MECVLSGNNSAYTNFIRKAEQSGQSDKDIANILSSLPFVYETYFMLWLLRGTVSVHMSAHGNLGKTPKEMAHAIYQNIMKDDMWDCEKIETYMFP